MKPRQSVTTTALVEDTLQLTPTTVEIRFKIEDPEFTFRSGNWVDCFIPGVDDIGGFTVVTPPQRLPSLHLAVKGGSEHAPTVAAIQAKRGDIWQMRAGGDFEMRDSARDVLFLAGGIGINPMVAMIREKALQCGWSGGEQKQQLEQMLEESRQGSAVLLHSARSTEELAFRDEFVAFSRWSRQGFQYVPWLTREGKHAKRFDGSIVSSQLESLARARGNDISGVDVCE